MSSTPNELDRCLVLIMQALAEYYQLREGEIRLLCKRFGRPSPIDGFSYVVHLPNVPQGQFIFTKTQLEQSLNQHTTVPKLNADILNLMGLIKRRIAQVLGDPGYGTIVVEVKKGRRNGVRYHLQTTFSEIG